VTRAPKRLPYVPTEDEIRRYYEVVRWDDGFGDKAAEVPISKR
jgi:hypothetical protein